MFELAANQSLTVELTDDEAERLNKGGYLSVTRPDEFARAA
jgi:hypothetical protein